MSGTRADGFVAPPGGGPVEIDDLDGGDDTRSPLSGMGRPCILLRKRAYRCRTDTRRKRPREEGPAPFLAPGPDPVSGADDPDPASGADDPAPASGADDDEAACLICGRKDASLPGVGPLMLCGPGGHPCSGAMHRGCANLRRLPCGSWWCPSCA